MAPIGPKQLSWCSAWKSYAYLLDYNGRNSIRSVVILPRLVWRQQLSKIAAAREERGLVTWIIDRWLYYLNSSKVDVISSAFGFTERRYGQVYAVVNRFGGELLPCVVARTYFDLLVREGGVHPSRRRNLIDGMAAAAARRRARTSADEVAAHNHESCLKKVTKGTHMYLTVHSELCLYRGDSQHIAEGEEVLSTIVGGFPMRNDYSFRRAIAWLIRKAFEAGWEIRWKRRMFWNCSEQYAGGSTRAPASPLGARQFVGVFYGCCCASLASLATEILFSWIHRRKGMSRVFANARCIHIDHKA
ncbi:hypothetical protein HPB52_007004 [Rhipicephalus sanguineus]|uniref:Uncharacterized protein n=1 Tax=Rhipicephalus sanguineus TaxID=34632 RepID=A0A9D4PV66_RHISA|nr:hypothetical protein HPB52_007004 [Rhipicephalus sanguineus]